MSITYPEQAPAVAAAPTAATPPGSVRHPVLWLGAIFVVALGLRLWSFTAPFQQDEFGPVYAVAERAVAAGQMPSAADPLVPVASLEVVRSRSVLPYGIVNPLPLYHYILYGVVHVLPITDWALRLPSLLAGLGCVLGIYFLCRRLLGPEVALVAATLTAVDPMQIGVSALARPYALANVACVLSFLALLRLLEGKRTTTLALSALGYGLSLAFIGYMNSILLLIGVAHLALVLYAFSASEEKFGGRFGWWLGGCALAALLLVPEFSYIQQVRAFSASHREYMLSMEATRLINVLLHNSTFLVALLAAMAAHFIIPEMLGGSDAAAEEGAEGDGQPATEPAPAALVVPEEPMPESPLLIWMGRFWFFLPQITGLMLALAASQFLFVSRYLSYTTLGGVLLLAYWATRSPSRDVRLGVSLVTIVVMFLWGSFMTVGKGFGLGSPSLGNQVVRDLDMLDEEGRWKPGDVVLLRAGFLEGDFLTREIPDANREAIVGAIKAPLTTLYVNKTPKPVEVLTLSQGRGEKLATVTAKHCDLDAFYTPELAQKLRQHERFWICSQPYERIGFMSGFLPWLADALGWDLKAARARKDPERYFDVWTDIDGEDFVPGLSDAKPSDFSHLVLIRRKEPKGIFTLGALSAAAMPQGQLTVPVWVASQYRTPRPTEKPDLDAELDELLDSPLADAEKEELGEAPRSTKAAR